MTPKPKQKPEIRNQAPQVPQAAKTAPTPKLPIADKLRQCLNLNDPEKAKKQINQILDRERGHLGEAMNLLKRSQKYFEGLKKANITPNDLMNHEVVKYLIQKGDKNISKKIELGIQLQDSNFANFGTQEIALKTFKEDFINTIQNGIQEHVRIIEYRLAHIHRTKRFINQNLNEAMMSSNKHEKTKTSELNQKYRELMKLFCETHALYSLFFDQLPKAERYEKDNRLKQLRTQLENIRTQINNLNKEEAQEKTKIQKEREAINQDVQTHKAQKLEYDKKNTAINKIITKYNQLTDLQNENVAKAQKVKDAYNKSWNPWARKRLAAEFKKFNSQAASYKTQRDNMASKIAEARKDKKTLSQTAKSLNATKSKIEKRQAALTKKEAELKTRLTKENTRLLSEQQKILDELKKKNITLLTEAKRQQVLKAADKRLNRIEKVLSKLDTTHMEYLSYRSAPEAMRKWFERTQQNYDVLSKGILGLPPALRNNYCDQMLKTFQQFEDINSGKAFKDYQAKMEEVVKKIYEQMKDGKFKGLRGKVQKVIHWGIDKVRNTMLGNGTSKQPDKNDNIFVEIAKKTFRSAAELTFMAAKEGTSPPKYSKSQLQAAFKASNQALQKLKSHVPIDQIRKWKKAVKDIRENGDEQLTPEQITRFQIAQREAMPGILNFIIKNNLVNEQLASQEFRRYHGKDSRYPNDRNLEVKGGQLLRFATRINPNDHPYRSLLSFMPWGIGAHLHTYKLKDGTIITPKSYWETVYSGVKNQSKLDRANARSVYGPAGAGLFALSITTAPATLAAKIPGLARVIPGLRAVGSITPWALGMTKKQAANISRIYAKRALKKGATKAVAIEAGKQASKNAFNKIIFSPLGRILRVALAVELSVFTTDALKNWYYGNEQQKVQSFSKRISKKIDNHLRKKFAKQLAKKDMTLEQLKLQPKVQEEMISYTNSLPEVEKFKARILHDAVMKYRAYFQDIGMSLEKLAPGAKPLGVHVGIGKLRQNMVQNRTLLELVNLLNYEFAKAGLIGYGMAPYPTHLVAKEMTLTKPRPNYYAYKELMKHQIASGKIDRDDLRHFFRLAYAIQTAAKKPTDKNFVEKTRQWLKSQNLPEGRITQASIEAQGQENLPDRQRRGNITVEKNKSEYIVRSHHTMSTKFKKLPKNKLRLPGIKAELTPEQARRLANLKHNLISKYPLKNAENKTPFYVQNGSLYFALAANASGSGLYSFIRNLSGKDVKVATKTALRRAGLKTKEDIKAFSKILNKTTLSE